MSRPSGVHPTNDGYTVDREYLSWLASWLDESCDHGPHLDHADCIAEIEAFINFFREKGKGNVP